MCLYLLSGKFFQNESVNRTEGEKQVSDIDLSPGDARPLTVVCLHKIHACLAG